jgi:hypothetical protein
VDYGTIDWVRPEKDPLVKADKPFGQWNHFRIIMAGSRV